MTYSLKYISDNGEVIDFGIDERVVITHAPTLTSVDVAMAETQGTGQVGKVVQGESVQGKVQALEGEIIGQTKAMRKKLIKAFAPATGGTLIYDNWLTMRVRTQTTPDIERYKVNAKFQLVLYAPYPYWTFSEQSMLNIFGVEPAFKFPINYSDTYFDDPKMHIFGRRTESDFTEIENTGNVPARFKVIFIAKSALSNPKLTKVLQGKDAKREFPYIRINHTFEIGERVEVDNRGSTLRVSLIKNGVETVDMGLYDLDSTLFDLDVGTTLLRADADTNRGGLECVVIPAFALSGAIENDG